MVFERLHGPLGPERHDYLTAQVCAVIANANRGKGKKAMTPADFAPPWADRKAWPWSDGKQQGPMSGDDILRAVKGLHKGMGGK